MRKRMLLAGLIPALVGCTTAYQAPEPIEANQPRCFEDTTSIVVNENTQGLVQYRSCRQARTGGGYVHRLEKWLGRNAQAFCQANENGHYRLIRKYVGKDGHYPDKNGMGEDVFRRARVEIVFVCTPDPSQATLEAVRNKAR